MAVVIETESGTVKLCSVDFEILSRLVDDERGVSYYQVRVKEPISQTKVVPCSLGATGVVKALASAGAFVRTKELTKYVEEYLSGIWETLPVKQLRADRTWGETATPDSGLVYEFFVEYVYDFAERFDAEEFGVIKVEGDRSFVYISRQVMHDFFKRMSIPQDQQANILKFWRGVGWLVPQRDGRHLTVVQRINGVLRRVYKIVLPALHREDLATAVVEEVPSHVETAAPQQEAYIIN